MCRFTASIQATGTALAFVAAAAVSVSAAAESDTDLVPPDEIENTYRAKRQGQQLYRAEKYEESLQYLHFAAERGFKESQAQLGQIYALGMGNVEQDIAQGIGWLGVAASGKTSPRIKKLYERVREGIPDEHQKALDRIVKQFTESYDGTRTRVTCELDQRAGTHTKTLRCRYIDEANYPSLNVRG